MADHHTGQCLCGAVTYRARGLADIWYCHCRQCRYVTGHYLPACRALRSDVEIHGEVDWSVHSGQAQLGRCASCAAPLFWSNPARDHLSVIPGSLDHSRGIAVRGHIFTAEMGDYYTITDGLPQYPRWPEQGLSAE